MNEEALDEGMDEDDRSTPKVEALPDPAHAGAKPHEPATCPVAWCPVCLAVTVVQPLRPDVIEHLLKAGTEFFLAMKAVIDVRADQVDADKEPEPPVRLEKIDLG
jgi:hypothetical protein